MCLESSGNDRQQKGGRIKDSAVNIESQKEMKHAGVATKDEDSQAR